MRPRPASPRIVVALLLLAALACGRDAAESPAAEIGFAGADPKAAVDASAGLAMSRAVPAPAAARVAPQGADPRARMPSVQRAEPRDSAMLIREGHVAIRVDSLEPAMDALRRLAASVGGTVGNVSITAGDYAVRSATLELRIPAARFDALMGGLAPIGKVEQSSVTAQDVGEEYVDLRARVANARRLETRLVDLLATRTGKLEDVLAVERELARVREEIERHEGRLRWLGSRVATSSVHVTVSERAPVVGDTPGRSVLGAAFVAAWRNFVALLAGGIASLGVLVPLAVAAWLAARWWRARRRRDSGA